MAGSGGSVGMCTVLVVVVVMVVVLGVCGVGGVVEYACDFGKDASLKSMAFCDTSQADDVRVKDLVSRMTLEEKVSQLVNTAVAIPRLGIPAYQWWQEGLHGVAHVPFGGALPRATSFPLPILTTATFNKNLWNQIGQVVSTEARAFYNDGLAGLTYWSPVINIARDPRWGRIQETSGEDPTTTSAYAAYFVRGMQEAEGDHPAGTNSSSSSSSKRLKLSACCKHFTAYDVDNWEGVDRYHFDAKVTAQDLADTYNPPFRSCVQDGRSTSLMCSYNKVNGVPTCANHDFLINTVRNTWGLDGYIVSDCDSVMVMHESTNYSPTTEDAAADALNAGLDLNCGDYLASYTAGAVTMGKVKQWRVDSAVSNLFAVRMKLGMFDGSPSTQRFGALGAADVCTSDHQELAVEAARQGIVLLKNDGGALPFSKSATLAVIGPNANATHTMLGNYEGVPCQYITPYQGLIRFGKVWLAPGCVSTACKEDYLIESAAETAANADAVVLVMGLSQGEESEALDRTSLKLPGNQEKLILRVAEAAAGRPIALVIMSGGPVDIAFAKSEKRIQSILWVGYPGQSGGQALAEIIFGDHNPGGKLPMSWYPQSYTNITMTNMQMRPDSSSNYPGRTYRFYTGQTIYDFGYGLSYTHFQHSFAVAPTSLTAPPVHAQLCDPHQQTSSSTTTTPPLTCSKAKQDSCALSEFEVHVDVENAGEVAGRHTVLMFSTSPSAGRNGVPVKELVAFDSVFVEAGRRQRVALSVNPCRHLGTVRGDGSRVVEAGNHLLTVGDASHAMAVLLSSLDDADLSATSESGD